MKYSNETYVSVPDYGELILNRQIMRILIWQIMVSVPDYGELILNLCRFAINGERWSNVSFPDFGELILNLG